MNNLININRNYFLLKSVFLGVVQEVEGHFTNTRMTILMKKMSLARSLREQPKKFSKKLSGLPIDLMIAKI